MNDSYLHIGIYIAYSRCAKRRTIIAICIQHIFLALMLIARSRLREEKKPFRMRLCTFKRVLRNGNCELIENYLGHIQIFLGILYYLFVCVIFFFFIFLRSHSDYYFNCKWFDFFSAFLHCWYCCRFCFYFIFFRF